MDNNSNENTVLREDVEPTSGNGINAGNGWQAGGGYTPPSNKSSKLLIVLLSVIAVLLAAIVAILLFKDSDSKEEPKKETPAKKEKPKETEKKAEPTDRTITVNGVSFKMIYVKGGEFEMGTNGGEFPRESPAHNVTVSDFYIGETEVTQELWEAVMGDNPSTFQGSKRPVETLDFDDCQEFIEQLNRQTGETFRLPFEAEWEFASRGGTKSKGYKYSGSNSIDDVAWYNRNSGNHSHEVATKSANELGIYDMSGNVWEWCLDFFDEDFYSDSPRQDPTGPDSGDSWLNRGGSWKSGAKYCRHAYRGQGKINEREGYLGMRLAIGTTTAPTKRRKVSSGESSSSDSGSHLAVIKADNVILPAEIRDAVELVPQSGGNVYCDFDQYYYPEIAITLKLLRKVDTAPLCNEFGQMWMAGHALDSEGREIEDLNPKGITSREWRDSKDDSGKLVKEFLEGDVGGTITLHFHGENNIEDIFEKDQSVIEAGHDMVRNAAKEFKKFRLSIPKMD